MEHFADRLAALTRQKGNSLCVGLDPRWQLLPEEIRARHTGGTLQDAASAYQEFCTRVIDIVAPLVVVIKPQSAFFEACGPSGMAALASIISYARQRGLLSIWDSKRGDVAETASAYADAAFTGFSMNKAIHPIWDADAVTVYAYLGRDSLEPFFERALRAGRGVFVLVRTSNPGAPQFQDLSCEGQPLYVHVARAVGTWARAALGACGMGAIGAVVGATYSEEVARLRNELPEVVFLVPGFGAQGAGPAEAAAAFRADGLGAVVNSSRGITFSYHPSEARWEQKIEAATKIAVDALKAATPMKMLSQSSAI
jgi:orotidine-5'-phosphate decarboxylase